MKAFFGDESGMGAFEVALVGGLLALAGWAMWQAGQEHDSRRTCMLLVHTPH